MHKYMLLLYDTPNAFAQVSPEDMQKVIQEYSAWAGKLGQEGKLLGGEKLTDEGGRVLRLEGGKPKVTDGPYSETKEVIGGYFVVQAKSYEDAVEIARSCPHARYGPKIEVRQVDQLGQG
jgi:hypothetical protein